MIRLLALTVLLLPSVAQAQLFPRLRAFNVQPNKVSSSCPGGICPTGVSAYSVPSYASTANTGGGHWSYPGTITNHLESEHGVSTSGLSRQEQLNLHDSLHEGGSPQSGRAPQATTYYYPSPSTPLVGSVVNYGSTGSVSFGSTGSQVVQSYGSTGSSVGSSVVASDSVTVLRLGDRAKFKRNLMAAAKVRVQPGVKDPADLEPGMITQDQYDALNFAIKFPGVAQKLEAALHETAIENGLASNQAIDWDKLAAFIERMIPIILKLIDLFSWNNSPQPQLDLQYTYHPHPDYQLAA